jgi:hypothetical protein
MTIYNTEQEAQIVADYNALRKVRRNNKPSIVKTLKDGTPTFLTSVVYTDPKFAKKIIDYFAPQFKPDDTFLDPCKGKGAFYDNLPSPKEWYEIQDGKDFLTCQNYFSWCFANFPWRGSVYSALARHSFKCCDNVVSLVKFSTAIGTTKRFKDALQNNMFMKEIIFADWDEAGFTFSDGSKKAKEGFILSIIHWQKNWNKGTTWSDWT